MSDVKPLVDAHHHVWDPDVRSQSWLDEPGHEPIRRALGTADLRTAATATGAGRASNPLTGPRMLRGADRLLHPGILAALAGAGHGAQVLLADGRYPASTATGPRARTVHLNLAPGLLDVTAVLDVLLRALPVESAQVMVPPEGEPAPPAVPEHRERLAPVPVGTLDRLAFYDAARSPDLALTVVTAGTRAYANLLLTIGVRTEGTLGTP